VTRERRPAEREAPRAVVEQWAGDGWVPEVVDRVEPAGPKKRRKRPGATGSGAGRDKTFVAIRYNQADEVSQSRHMTRRARKARSQRIASCTASSASGPEPRHAVAVAGRTATR